MPNPASIRVITGKFSLYFFPSQSSVSLSIPNFGVRWNVPFLLNSPSITAFVLFIDIPVPRKVSTGRYFKRLFHPSYNSRWERAYMVSGPNVPIAKMFQCEVQKRLEFLKEGDIRRQHVGQKFLCTLDRAFSPPELLALESIYLHWHLCGGYHIADKNKLTSQ